MVRQDRICREFWNWVKSDVLVNWADVVEVEDFGVWVAMVNKCIELEDMRGDVSAGYSFKGRTKNGLTVFVYLVDVDGGFSEENIEWIRIKGRGGVVDIFPPDGDEL